MRIHSAIYSLFLPFCLTALLLGTQAREAVAKSATTGSTVPGVQPGNPAIEQQFLEGLLLLEGGHPEKAIPILQRILASDPTLVRVRLELARAYYEAEQWNRAREEFFTVLSGDLPDTVRYRVMALIQAIDARRGFDWDLTVGLTSVGNRRRYDTEQINLDFSGIVLPFEFDRPISNELGVRVAGSATYRRNLDFSLNHTANTVAFVSIDFDLVDASGSQYDDYNLGAQLGLRIIWPTTSLIVAPFVATRFLAGAKMEDRLGLEASFEKRNLFGGSIFGTASIAGVDSAISEDRSGRVTSAALGFRRSLGGRASIGSSIRIEENRVEFDLEDYWETEIRVFGSYDAIFGLTFRPSLYMSQKAFRNPSPLFTASPNETSLGISLRVEKNDVFIGDGFSPFASVQFERTKSDIDAFSFREGQIQFGLKRRF